MPLSVSLFAGEVVRVMNPSTMLSLSSQSCPEPTQNYMTSVATTFSQFQVTEEPLSPLQHHPWLLPFLSVNP